MCCRGIKDKFMFTKVEQFFKERDISMNKVSVQGGIEADRQIGRIEAFLHFPRKLYPMSSQ